MPRRAQPLFNWTEEAVAIVSQMYDNGAASPLIAQEINRHFGGNVTSEAVRRIVNRFCAEESDFRQQDRQARHEASAVEALRLAREGHPTTEIARRLGYTRWWVYDTVPPEERINARWLDRLVEMCDRRLESYLSGQPLYPVPEDPIVASGRTFAAKASDDCCWPIGVNGDGDAMFCLGKRSGRSSYCVEHKQRSVKQETSDVGRDAKAGS